MGILNRSSAGKRDFYSHASTQQRVNRQVGHLLVLPADGIESERKAGSRFTGGGGLIDRLDIGIVRCVKVEIARCSEAAP